jgi:hypothetical protein
MTTVKHRRRARGVATVLVLVAVAAAALLVWMQRPQETTRPFNLASPSFKLLTTAPPKGECADPATKPFTPTRITIPQVVKNGQVLAAPRDAQDLPSTPPTSAKYAFAWDRPPGIMPGSDRGNVLLNAHTWPDGSAVGNAMLDKLDKGDRIILSGNGSKLCYTVTKRLEVRASEGYVPYYDRVGSPQVAVVVCSGRHLGPANWTHRTIWFAEPTTDAS